MVIQLRLSLLTLLTISTASATIINVPADIDSIQGGINLASDGDTVLVQPGIYVENINFNGKNIVVGSLTLTTGDTSYICRTVIDGDRNGTVVTFENGEDSTTVLIGFTIINGSSLYGGGIYCGEYTEPNLKHLVITDNLVNSIREGPAFGGGICCDRYSKPTIVNSKIHRNEAVSTGAAGAYGGGIICEGSIVRLLNVVITDNYALVGGGIVSTSSVVIIDNNTISGNSGYLDRDGGGLLLGDRSVVSR